MENFLEICKILYPDYQVDIYDEAWSQGNEFLIFSKNNNYINRIHKYQLADIIKMDLISNSDNNLVNILK